MKVLIVEKNAKVGGYCTSFERNGFLFDACAHAIGSCRRGGLIRKILRDLEIYSRIKLIRHSLSDIIITPDYKVSFYSDYHKTVKELQEKFPKEVIGIESFFEDLVKSNDLSLFKTRYKTFDYVLNHYFRNKELKAILSLPILGNAGLPPSLISAFSASLLFREFVIDGGYYPAQGMQSLPENLSKRFKELGGNLLLSQPVSQIRLRNKKAVGVRLMNNSLLNSHYVVSACDMNQTYTRLISRNSFPNFQREVIANQRNSLSMFILYLGLNKKVKFPKYSNVWYLPNYDIKKLYQAAYRSTLTDLAKYFMIRISHNQRSLTILSNANYKLPAFWNKNNESLSTKLIKRLDKIIPFFSNHIVFKGIATPETLFQWTSNYRGSSYGWAALPNQLLIPNFTISDCVKNLVFAGHWTTMGLGLPGVMFSGLNSAKIILKKDGKKEKN
jgi:phytoene dehydrogenase-like protein